MTKLLIKPMEAAEVLSIGRDRIYTMLAEGSIPSIRIGQSAHWGSLDHTKLFISVWYEESS